MAFQKPPHSQKRTFDGSMNLQGLNHIVGATRLKAAAPSEERAKDDLVASYQQYEQVLHGESAACEELAHFVGDILAAASA